MFGSLLQQELQLRHSAAVDVEQLDWDVQLMTACSGGLVASKHPPCMQTCICTRLQHLLCSSTDVSLQETKAEEPVATGEHHSAGSEHSQMGQGLAAAINVVERHLSIISPERSRVAWSDDVLTTACKSPVCHTGPGILYGRLLTCPAWSA